MIYVIIMFCIGLTIGGFSFGNKTIGIIGIIGVVVLTIIGLITNYIKQKSQFNNERHTAFNSYCSTDYSKKRITTATRSFFDSQINTVERCKEMFEKSEILLNSEYNDYMFGIDLEGNKRPLANINNAKVKEVLDDSIDLATAAYLSINDLIVSPWQYLKKSLQIEIVNKYKEVSPYTAFLFLNDYYKKYDLLLVVYKGQTTYFATPEKYKFNL